MISSFKSGITKHRISIFLEMGNLRSLSTSNRNWGWFISSQDPMFQKIGSLIFADYERA